MWSYHLNLTYTQCNCEVWCQFRRVPFRLNGRGQLLGTKKTISHNVKIPNCKKETASYLNISRFNSADNLWKKLYSCKSENKAWAFVWMKIQNSKFGHSSHEKFVLYFDICRMINVKEVLPLLIYISKGYSVLKQ